MAKGMGKTCVTMHPKTFGTTVYRITHPNVATIHIKHLTLCG